MAGHVRRDEEWIGGEAAPRVADGAETAELLGRKPQEDVEQHVRG